MVMKFESTVLDLPHVLAPNSRSKPVSFELASNHLVLAIKTARHVVFTSGVQNHC